MENKRKIKSYYDMQVLEKKKMNAYERDLDCEQAKIWEIDCQRFKAQEKEVNDKVFLFILIFLIIFFID